MAAGHFKCAGMETAMASAQPETFRPPATDWIASSRNFSLSPESGKGWGTNLWVRHGWTFHSSQLNQTLSLDMFGYCCLSFSMSPVPAKIHRCLALQSRAGLCWWRYRMVQGREFGFWPFRCGDGSKFSTDRIWKRHDKTSREGPWVSLLVLNSSIGT